MSHTCTNIAIDMTGNFVGPLVFTKDDAPRYPKGFLVVVITALIAGLLAPAYRLLCMWENKRRDKAGVPEGFDNAYDDDLTDVKVRATDPMQSPSHFSPLGSGPLKCSQTDVVHNCRIPNSATLFKGCKPSWSISVKVSWRTGCVESVLEQAWQHVKLKALTGKGGNYNAIQIEIEIEIGEMTRAACWARLRHDLPVKACRLRQSSHPHDTCFRRQIRQHAEP